MAETSLQGTIEGITYRNDQNDWSVLSVRTRESNVVRLCKVTGHTSAQVGQGISATGTWKRYKEDLQFDAKTIVAYLPQTPEGIRAFLGSGMIPGVGEKTAQLMVHNFGADVLRILDEEPEKLRSIKGIGPAKAAKIETGWQEQKKVSEIMVFLHSQQISPALCRRIYRTYGDESIKVMKDNPYRLCFEVRGIGFKTADAVGANLAIPKTSKHRLLAGLSYLMNEAMTQGHCGQARADLLKQAAEALEVAEQPIADVLQEDLDGEDHKPKFFQDRANVYLAWLARAEEHIAERLTEMARHKPSWTIPSSSVIDDCAHIAGVKLASKQRRAVEMALESKVCVISGGPGVGKTTTLNSLLAVMREMKLNIALAAPTGKAAQRAKEATGLPASTIHRLLGIRGDGAAAAGELDADVLVIDEFSMVDVPLMLSIIKCLAPRTVLIMVGDVDQLPSVGPGQVLGDTIKSGKIPVTILDEVFRQAQGSLIIRNAHAINHGEYPVSGSPGDDFFILTEKNVRAIRDAVDTQDDEARPALVAKAVAQEIELLQARRLPSKYGLDPVRDIQVLCPMNGGDCGVRLLNERMQAALNPDPAVHVTRYGTRFGLGDKVIQTRNNYDLGVYNGDMGIVAGIDREDEHVRVEFDGRLVQIPFDDLDDLRLAYAMTIHKSQGSQAQAIIIPVVTQSWMMLQRNLLYTGVTRARRLVVLVGQSRAIAKAVRTADAKRRITRLCGLLKEQGMPEDTKAREPEFLFS